MPPHPQIKICGLTREDQAAACVAAGADAIGLIFYPKSPRHVSDTQGARIAEAVAGAAALVGVFVDAAEDEIIRRVKVCRLTAVQLHGKEPATMVDRLKKASLIVIKTLFASRPPGFDRASEYQPSALLVECGQGSLPGGNARLWNWAGAAALDTACPIVLAGGLAPHNVNQAISAARPAAVDISSGVEQTPGVKDLKRVRHFIREVQNCTTVAPLAPVFSERRSSC
jgi:phosphoribosylanthranilate isomerase